MKLLFMVKYLFYTLLFIYTIPSYSATTALFNDPKADQVFITLTGTGMSMNLADYIKLKPSDFKRLTGQKLTLKETIAFKINQKQIKKTIRKDGTVDLSAFHKKNREQSKWHWGGFFLGMLFPIGLIIALSINDEKRKDRIRSSLFGMAAVLLIALLVGLLIGPIGI